METDWDLRFLQLAKHISSWSKDPSTKVGAVIVDPNRRIVSTGYNGFPRNVNDDSRYDNRELKYEMIIHAEVNAILFADRNLNGCTLYTYPLMPCSRCASIVIQSGIKRVVSIENIDVRWKASFNLSKNMFNESNVELIERTDYVDSSCRLCDIYS